MARKHFGRKRGSRNKGFFYRSGTGWYSKEGGRFTPLTDENGNRLKDPEIKESVVKKKPTPAFWQQKSRPWSN
ncbi:hypothetical protein [Bremerella cremea]|uniref:hypothetical protein n=1 Tax=Bremerella cremea TaxID=1031537 RepID=UPI0031E78D51